MPDFTLSLTTAEANRAAKAFGRYWGLKDADGRPRDATAAEVKEYLVRQLRGVVRQQERAKAEADLPEPAQLAVS